MLIKQCLRVSWIGMKWKNENFNSWYLFIRKYKSKVHKCKVEIVITVVWNITFISKYSKSNNRVVLCQNLSFRVFVVQIITPKLLLVPKLRRIS